MKVLILILMTTFIFAEEKLESWEHWNTPNIQVNYSTLLAKLKVSFNNKKCNQNKEYFFACMLFLNEISNRINQESNVYLLSDNLLTKISVEDFFEKSDKPSKIISFISNPLSYKYTPYLFPIGNKVSTFFNKKKKSSSQKYQEEIHRQFLEEKNNDVDFKTELIDNFEKSSPDKINEILGMGLSILLQTILEDPMFYILPRSIMIPKQDNRKYAGIGAGVEKVEQGIILTHIMNGGSAQANNLKAGDIITHVDGNSLKDLNLNEGIELVIGEEESFVTLRIKEVDIEIQRKKVVVKTVSSRMIHSNIGYILYRQFITGSHESFKKEVLMLKNQGAKKIILDLRANPGGNLEDSRIIADYFLKKGQEVYNIDYLDSKREDQNGFSNKESIFNGELIVLINRNSASASEVIAGAFQDNDRAIIIGETSFGKGSMQELMPILTKKKINIGLGELNSPTPHPNLWFKKTTAYFLNPSGRSPQSVGIIPDIKIIDSDLVDIPAKRSKDMFMNPLKPKWFKVKKSKQRNRYLKSVKRCYKRLDIEEIQIKDNQLNDSINILDKCMN